MTKKVEKSEKKNKKYLLLLLLLFLSAGIWQCPKFGKDQSSQMVLPQKDSLELVATGKAATPRIDTAVSMTKAEANLPITKSKKEDPKTASIPIERTASPVLETEEKEIIPEKQTTPAIVIQVGKEKVDQPLAETPKNSCVTNSKFKIDRSTFQRSLAFSPDGSRFVVGNNNNLSSIFDLSGKEISKLVGHTGYVLATAYSPDGKYIATGSVDKSAKLWNASNGKMIRTFAGHLESVSSLVFSPNGKYLLTGSIDSTSVLWDVQSGNQLRRLQAHTLEVTDVAFSPNGRYVATTSADKTAKIWDIQSGKVLLSLEGHQQLVRTVVFTPNGKFILTAGSDKTVRLWNAKSGKHLRTLKGHQAGIRHIDIS